MLLSVVEGLNILILELYLLDEIKGKIFIIHEIKHGNLLKYNHIFLEK